MNQRTSPFQSKNAPVRIFSNTLIWENLLQVPNSEWLRSGKHICVNYNALDEEKLLNWAKFCQASGIKQKIPFLQISVFAKFEDLPAGEVPRLATTLGRFGVTIADYPEKSNTFEQAVKNFNQQISESVKRVNRYAQNRVQRMSSNKNFTMQLIS